MTRAVIVLESIPHHYDLGKLLCDDIDDSDLRKKMRGHIQSQLPRTNFASFGDPAEGDFQTALLMALEPRDSKNLQRLVWFIRLADAEDYNKLREDVRAVQKRAGPSPFLEDLLKASSDGALKEILKRKDIFLFYDYQEVQNQFDQIKGDGPWLGIWDLDETTFTGPYGREVLIPGHHEMVVKINATHRYLPSTHSDFLYVVTARPEALEIDQLDSLWRLGEPANHYRYTAIRSGDAAAFIYYVVDRERFNAALAEKKLQHIRSIRNLWSGFAK